jgi:hypothetical protein
MQIRKGKQVYVKSNRSNRNEKEENVRPERQEKRK